MHVTLINGFVVVGVFETPFCVMCTLEATVGGFKTNNNNNNNNEGISRAPFHVRHAQLR